MSSRLFLLLAFAVLWIGALFLMGPYDLTFSRNIADQSNPFGAFIQHFGTMPALIIYLTCIFWLALPTLRRRSRPMSRAACAVLVQALLHTFALTNSIKFAWGRERFADLASGYTDYTPFYSPNLSGDGLSFPSGHVATAVVAIPLVLLFIREGKRRAALLSALVVFAWGFLVAYGRILYGAHYLTDVFFSAGLAVLFAPVSIFLGDKYLSLFERKKGAKQDPVK